MALDQAEEFLGPGLTGARARRSAWGTLALYVGLGLAVLLLWGITVANRVVDEQHAVSTMLFVYLAPFGGLLLIGAGIRGALRAFRLAAQPDTERVWYVLHPDGLILRQSVGLEIAEGGQVVVPWAWMEKLVPIAAAVPWLRLSYRAPGAKVSGMLELKSHFLSRDGAPFGDRMRLWYDAKAAPSAR